jgi:hypothetical protein
MSPEDRLAHRVLAELIYERVRVTIDMAELFAFEQDLAASIERALAGCDAAGLGRTELIFDYLTAAWERISDDVMGDIGRREAPP